LNHAEPVLEPKTDRSRETALLELFSMGMLTEPELKAELARLEEAESGGRLEVISWSEVSTPPAVSPY
jgi:hypothetical protein